MSFSGMLLTYGAVINSTWEGAGRKHGLIKIRIIA